MYLKFRQIIFANTRFYHEAYNAIPFFGTKFVLQLWWCWNIIMFQFNMKLNNFPLNFQQTMIIIEKNIELIKLIILCVVTQWSTFLYILHMGYMGFVCNNCIASFMTNKFTVKMFICSWQLFKCDIVFPFFITWLCVFVNTTINIYAKYIFDIVSALMKFMVRFHRTVLIVN